MRARSGMPVVLVAMLLAACNAELEMELGLNELLNGKQDAVTATLALKVKRCDDTESVREGREEVEGIFTGEQFVKCIGSS